MQSLRSVVGSVARRPLLLGLLALGLGGAGSFVWWRSRDSARAVESCRELPALKPSYYRPISVGPIAFDPGSEVGGGSELRWLGRTAEGYIVKSFLIFEPGDQRLTLTGRNTATGRALLFSYSAEGYTETLELDPATAGRAGSDAAKIRGLPGALAAPEPGGYRVAVRREDGRTWESTLWVCKPAKPPTGPLRTQ